MNADNLVEFYSGIMQDDNVLSEQQQSIATEVDNMYTSIANVHMPNNITSDEIHCNILRLKCNSSPGLDGMCSEYFKYGNTTLLCNHLSSLYSNILAENKNLGSSTNESLPGL